MFTFIRLITVLPLLLLFSLLVIHAAAQPNPDMRNTSIQVDAGNYYTCGIRVNDTVQCWGNNEYGESTVPADLGTVKAVSAGGFHTCTIRSDDTPQCWGFNGFGQMNLPVDLGTIKGVSAGFVHTCAIRSDDTLRCWGGDNFGQTTPPDNLGTVKGVSAGYGHTCAIRSDDTLRCWGLNDDQQRTVPVDLGTVKGVSAGDTHTCAIRSDDTLRCWGGNPYEQSTVPLDLGTVRRVSAGGSHTCAIKSDNTLRCWGYNLYEQSTVPLDLGTVHAVSTGSDHTCAIKIDDTLRCWGDNGYDQSTPPLPSISMILPSLVLIEGSSTTVKVSASDYPWNNITVSMSYAGTALRNSDYNAPSVLAIGVADNSADVVITTLDDSQIEPDETIIIDIASVTGGTENGTQQVILVIQDNDNVTPTPTPPSGNLLVNAGFEAGLAPWVVKSGVGDKVKCNKDGKPPVARTGTCTFQFKSGAGEKTSLQQTLATQTWVAGDTLQLSLFVKVTNGAASGKIKVRVKYSDGTETGKIDVSIGQSAEYTELTGSHTLLSANVSKVKLSVQNRSAAGKVLVDDVVLAKAANGLMGLP
jgi:hypothetical protein